MKVKFYLRTPTKDCVSAIYATICYNCKRVKVYPHLSIHRKDWNFEEGKPKSGAKNATINSRLFKAEKLYWETYDMLYNQYGNNISPKIFKNTIEKKDTAETKMNENEPILISDFLQTMFDDSKSGKRKTVDGMKFKPGSIKPYISTKNHFVAFSKRKKYYLTDIDQTLINDFTEYLNGFLALNASAKYLTVFKSLLSYAIEKKLISVNVSLENKVRVRKAKADDIYLTETEIQAMMDIKQFSTKMYMKGFSTKMLEEVRDLFVIGCNTGLRFQDYSMLKTEQIRDGFLEFDPKKLEGRFNLTTKVVIPVLPMFEEIIKKYPNGFPKSPCNQVFNKCLKVIGEKIPSLNVNYEKKIVKGNEVQRKKLKKYQMVVTHSARRSFCSNMYLKGIPVPTIMAISGHRTEENFLKYIKIDNRKHAQLMKEIIENGDNKVQETQSKG